MSDTFESSIFNQKHRRRVLICVRGNCAPAEEGQDLATHLQRLIKNHGLDEPSHPQSVSCRQVQCLGVCHSGPIIMVHPEAIRYHQVDIAALDRIFQEHLVQGNPVADLILPPSRY